MRKLLLIILFLLFTQSSYGKWTDFEKKTVLRKCLEQRHESFDLPDYIIMCNCTINESEKHFTPDEVFKSMKLPYYIDTWQERVKKAERKRKKVKEKLSNIDTEIRTKCNKIAFSSPQKKTVPKQKIIIKKEKPNAMDQFITTLPKGPEPEKKPQTKPPKQKTKPEKKPQTEPPKQETKPEEEKDSADEIAKLKETDPGEEGVFGYGSPAEFKKKEHELPQSSSKKEDAEEVESTTSNKGFLKNLGKLNKFTLKKSEENKVAKVEKTDSNKTEKSGDGQLKKAQLRIHHLKGKSIVELYFNGDSTKTIAETETCLKEIKSNLLKNEYIDGVKLYLEVESNSDYLQK